MDKDPNTGRFVRGNRAAVGRATPRERRRQKFTNVIDATPAETFTQIWAGVLAAAMGDEPEPWAVKLVIELCLGDKVQRELSERLEDIEEAVGCEPVSEAA